MTHYELLRQLSMIQISHSSTAVQHWNEQQQKSSTCWNCIWAVNMPNFSCFFLARISVCDKQMLFAIFNNFLRNVLLSIEICNGEVVVNELVINVTQSCYPITVNKSHLACYAIHRHMGYTTLRVTLPWSITQSNQRSLVCIDIDPIGKSSNRCLQ